MKIRTRLILLLMVITIIPLGCLTVFSYYQFYRSIERNISTIAEDEYTLISGDVKASYDSIRQVVNLLTFYSSDDNSIISTLRSLNAKGDASAFYDLFRASQNLQNECRSIMFSYESVNSVTIFTSGGDVLSYARSSYGGISSDYDPSEDEWYRETLDLNGSLFISSPGSYPMFGSDPDCFFVSFLFRDVDRNFEPLGVIVLEYATDLFDLGKDNTLADMATITLLNTENQSVLYTNAEGTSDEKSVRSANHRISGEIFPTPFELTMSLDYDSLLEEYNGVLLLLIMLALFLFLCSLLLILYVIQSFINPVVELSGQMLEQSYDNKEIQYPPAVLPYAQRKDEIGTLYQQYYHMLEENREYVKNEYENRLIMVDAKMQALEARIDSHFLFNTLEQINSMAELAGQDQISAMSLALGNMFRYAIKTESELVTIQEELDHVHDYLTIQRIRYNNAFVYEEEIPKELQKERILKLILQPVVENSFIHGLDMSTNSGRLWLTVQRDKDVIKLEVTDNGRGIAEEQLAALQEKLKEEPAITELGHRQSESIGLKNIHSRIELYYGKGYGLQLESTKGVGTRVIITVPLLSDKQEE